MSGIRCGVLERGEVFSPLDGAATLRAMLEEAVILDDLGYSRLWYSEHHNPAFSHSAPEIMTAAAGARTRRIRVGSAGVLLYFYSPYKVASLFRTLSTLHPERVDMGVAAGWSSPVAQQALLPGFDFEVAQRDRHYARKVEELMGYLARQDDGGDQPIPCPADGVNPSVWLLGASGGVGNMTLAATHGTSFCYFLCFGPEPDPSVIDRYRSQFESKAHPTRSTAAIASRFVCRETNAQAEASVDFDVTPFDIVGTPELCRERTEELVAEYGCDEFILIPTCPDRGERREGYALMAEALGVV